MMARIFNPESPFWVAVSRVADLVWLNILFVFCSIPIVTIGGALTALYDTAWRLSADVGGSVTREFFGSLRRNFWPSTALWLVFAPAGAALLWAWLFLPISELAVMKLLLSVVYVLIFPFPWFLQARFVNTVWGTLKNSLLMPLSRLPFAAGALLINLVLIALAVWTVIDLPQIIPLFLLVGFALPTAATMPLLTRVISPWVERPTTEVS